MILNGQDACRAAPRGTSPDNVARRNVARRGVLVLVLCAAVPAAAGSIEWHTRLDRASAVALETDRPMLLEFWAVWCAACKVMDAEVFSHGDVVRAMSRVVPVRIDVDRQQSVARRYGVSGTPTLIYTDSRGNELFRFTGAVTAVTMTQLLGELPRDVADINRLTAIVARDRNNFDALEALGRELRAVRLYRASNGYYDRAMRTRAARDRSARRAEMLLDMARNHLELQAFGDAARTFERYLQEFPGGPAEAEAMLGLGRALLFERRTEAASRILEILIARYPTDPAHGDAIRLLAGLRDPGP
jgi:thioredoxin-like negative regulator of GroEL